MMRTLTLGLVLMGLLWLVYGCRHTQAPAPPSIQADNLLDSAVALIKAVRETAHIDYKHLQEDAESVACDRIIENMPGRPPIFFTPGVPYPFYDTVEDKVYLPMETMVDPMLYSFVFHELAHSTMHESRLGVRYDHPFEEIITDLTSLVLSAKCGKARLGWMHTFEYVHSWSAAIDEYASVLMTEEEILEAVQARVNYISPMPVPSEPMPVDVDSNAVMP